MDETKVGIQVQAAAAEDFCKDVPRRSDSLAAAPPIPMVKVLVIAIS
jgi:hypothetical protein